jgi:hypothetical protein
MFQVSLGALPRMRFRVTSPDQSVSHYLNDPAMVLYWAISLADEFGTATIVESDRDGKLHTYTLASQK